MTTYKTIDQLNPAGPITGTEYLEVSQGGISARATIGQVGGLTPVSPTPPSSPANGTLWWNSDLGSLFVWYDDGNSAQWVPATPTAASGVVSLDAFGAVGDGVTDDTPAMLAAVAAAVAQNATLFCPAGKYRLTGRIQPSAPVTIIGETPTIVDGTPSVPDKGTWFFLDHLDYGFKYRNDTTLANYKFSVLENIGTWRSQPAAAPGWAPNAAFLHDIYNEWTLTLRNVFLLNPTKGVLVRGSGVLLVEGLKGQPFTTGIECERSADVQDWRDIHWWPYWSQDATVALYTLNNCNGILIKRSDGLNVVNYFTILCRRSVYMVEDVSLGGAVGAFNFVDLISDIGGGSIEIVSAATGVGHWGNFVNVMNNGDAALRVSAPGVSVTGPVVNRININNLHSRRSGKEAIITSGAAHVVRVGVGHFSAYNFDASGVACLSADTGASILMNTTPTFTSATNPVYNTNTSGIIRVPITSAPVGTGSTTDVQLNLSSNNRTGSFNKVRFTDLDVGALAGQPIGEIEFFTNDSSAPGARVAAKIGAYQDTTAAGYYYDFKADLSTGTAYNIARIGWRGIQIFSGGFGRTAPVTKTANFTVAHTENWLINNKAGSSCTVTLPVVTDVVGRELMITNYQAFTVVSATANVVPLGGGVAATAVLSANIGRWCVLVSDGTNWVITMGVI